MSMSTSKMSSSSLKLLRFSRRFGSAPPPMGGTTGREYLPPSSTFGGDDKVTMRSWQLHSYSGPSELQLTTTAKLPVINSPREILVKIKAASVNPIDLAMTRGYGAETINLLRDLCPSSGGVDEVPKKLVNYLTGQRTVIEFPLTLGRDFAGVVEHLGQDCQGDLRVGDQVFGVVGVNSQGSHADYVVVQDDTIRRMPKNLSFVEAASLPYVACTTWSALTVTGNFVNLAQKRFLVLGASGGVGTFCIQYLKSQGALVTATCSPDAMDLLSSLKSTQKLINYQEPEVALDQIKSGAPYDCILHLSGPTTLETSLKTLTSFLKPLTGQFITLSPPFLQNVDNHGLLFGSAKNLIQLITQNLQSLQGSKSCVKWAFFVPSGHILEKVAKLVESGEIKPVVDSVVNFTELPKAYQKVDDGHLRGKVVINMN